MRFATLAKSAVGLALLGGAGFYALTMPSTIPEALLPPRAANLQNGETMFNIGGCASCHQTPKQENRLLLGGGHELKTQFGTFVVPNISSDAKNGLGGWTEAQFTTSMVKGVGRNGEHLYPAFPYTSYQRMKLEDIRDLFAFMKTLPAETTPSQPHKVSFPFNVRRGLGMWKLLFLDGKPFVPDPSKDAMLNRGAYLIEGPGHCAECHSSRNLLGAITAAGRMAGGPDAEGKSFVPNITPHADGLAKWSAKDIEYMLETGFTPENDVVGSSMAEVIPNTSKLSAEDRRAMAAYLKSLPPKPGAKAKPKA
jgi:mono/diheme cytochrome c family protein